jgi:hypothetical protein
MRCVLRRERIRSEHSFSLRVFEIALNMVIQTVSPFMIDSAVSHYLKEMKTLIFEMTQ